jgi:hypothetical protein
VATVLAELHEITDSAEAAHMIATHVELDPRLMRTGEMHDLRGDATLAAAGAPLSDPGRRG